MFDSALIGYQHYYQMLSDRVRTEAFRSAIRESVRPGDVVLDLGAGTGILGIWALQAGAAKVYAIEQSEAIVLAREIAQANGCADRMVFIQQNSLDVELETKADVLISETLGSFAIDENLLRFLPDARDRLLKPGGRMLPSNIRLFAAPVEAPDSYQKIDFWRHGIGGVDFTPAFEVFSRKMLVESVGEHQLLGAPVELQAIDLRRWRDSDYRWRGYFDMRRRGTLHGIAAWFEAQLGERRLRTCPGCRQTHWKQAVFPFREPIRVVRGDVLDWEVVVGGRAPDADHTRIAYQYRCTQLANERRPGRNDPCPCGSGKKYKKCCGG